MIKKTYYNRQHASQSMHTEGEHIYGQTVQYPSIKFVLHNSFITEIGVRL